MKMKTFKIGDFITFGGAIVSDVRKIELHETLTASGGRRVNFDGSYYFGGTNGALLQKSTVTDDGFIVDDTG